MDECYKLYILMNLILFYDFVIRDVTIIISLHVRVTCKEKNKSHPVVILRREMVSFQLKKNFFLRVGMCTET